MNSQIHGATLPTRMLQGAGMVLGMMALRLWSGFEQMPSSQLPLLVVVLAVSGGAGGAVHYCTDAWRARGGVARTVANVISILAYCAVAALVVLLVFK